MEKIKLGISSCLLGAKVRYDGGHQWDRFITGTLGRYVEFVRVCPEVESGLPVPREAMRLVGEPLHPRLVTVRTGVDQTERLATWAQRRVRELAALDLWGFIFKGKSPSCGLDRVKVYPGEGAPSPQGAGIFARSFMEHFPLLPVVDEGRLHDPARRENFLARLFVLKRWRELLADHPGIGSLVAFHTRHKLLIRSHSPSHYRALGQLVARARELPPQEVFADYQARLLEALGLRATPRKHADVLYHLLGYFKKQLTSAAKQELMEAIAAYRREDVPLLVPLTLINHYGRRYDQPYLKEQYYLNPHPLELMLRHHV